MRAAFWGMALSAVLAGCGQGDAPSAAGGKVSLSDGGSSSASPNDGKVIIRLSDGTGISFEGTLKKDELKPSGKGQLKVYEIDLVGDRAVVERGVFDVLSKAGYVQNVQAEKDSSKKIHYSKKSYPVVGGFYSDRLIEGEKGVRLSLYWQET